MTAKGTLLTIGLCAALGGAYWWSEQHASPPRIEQPADGQLILPLARGDEIIQLSIDSAQDTIVVQRSAKGWHLTQPIAARAEDLKVGGMATALRLNRQISPWDIAGEEEHNFGLTPPRIRVGVQTEREPSTRYLLLGDQVPLQPELYYAKWEHMPRVFMVNANFYKLFRAPAHALRKKGLFDFALQDVVEINVSHPQDVIALEREGEAWRFVGSGQPARTALVEEYLRDILSLYAQEFFDEASPDAAQFGFAQPRTRLRVTLADGTVQQLVIGHAVEGEESLYAQREQGAPIIRIAQQQNKQLERTASFFIDKTIFSSEIRVTNYIGIDTAQHELRYAQEGHGWRPMERTPPVNDLDVYLERLLTLLEKAQHQEIVSSRETEDLLRRVGTNIWKFTFHFPDGATFTVAFFRIDQHFYLLHSEDKITLFEIDETLVHNLDRLIQNLIPHAV